MKRAPAARRGQDVGITQPRDHSLADPCKAHKQAFQKRYPLRTPRLPRLTREETNFHHGY